MPDPRQGNGISGVAVAVTLAGAVFLYSGLRGKSISGSIGALLLGNSPSTATQDNPIQGGSGDNSAVAGQSDMAVPITGTTSNANAQTIAAFFTAKGLSPGQVSGILGNIQIESGFNPAASNAGEGAIGLAQWEGGRRTALQKYAASQGTSETDLNTQLNYYWAELNGSYPTALNALRLTNDPATAATVIDSQYEHSSGSARSARIAAAQQWFATLWSH